MRILVVVQRYGAEVVGGSEGHARTVAHRLARRHEVEVATTTALDYWSWAEHYAAGESVDDGVLVRRFAVRSGRGADYKAVESRVLLGPHTLADEYAWLRVQGPHAPQLFEFLHRDGQRYQTVIFYTYIYEPTALGLPIVPERALLVSTAHDELPLRLAPYRALFQLPRAIAFLTPEERDLVHREFRNEHIPSDVVGVPLDPAPRGDGARFRAAHRIEGPIVLYLGQVSEAKGCAELLSLWTARERDATLVLLGHVRMPIPSMPSVRALDAVSDETKWDGLAAADVLVQPSRFESLGLVLLEGWQQGTPALVQAGNPVTAGQVRRSGGGLAYEDAASFDAGLERLLAEGRARGERARDWVRDEYAPERFDRRIEDLVGVAAAIG